MTTLREAAQQALEALEGKRYTACGWRSDCDKAITALRAALAEHDKKIVWVEERKAHWAEQLQLARETQERERQQREEAALAEPVQEPVAWLYRGNLHATDPSGWCIGCPTPLYAAPPQRKPLTEEEIAELARQEQFLLVCDGLDELTEIARAIERAHGIKE